MRWVVFKEHRTDQNRGSTRATRSVEEWNFQMISLQHHYKEIITEEKRRVYCVPGTMFPKKKKFFLGNVVVILDKILERMNYESLH